MSGSISIKAKKLIDGENKTKIGIVSAGGGIHLADILKIPGASKAIAYINFPYDEESFIESCGFINVEKSVSQEAVHRLIVKQIEDRFWEETRFVAISAALTTERWRHGDNHAWIAFFDPNISDKIRYFHIKLPKLDELDYQSVGQRYIESLRFEEDKGIVTFVINLLNEEPFKDNYFFTVKEFSETEGNYIK